VNKEVNLQVPLPDFHEWVSALESTAMKIKNDNLLICQNSAMRCVSKRWPCGFGSFSAAVIPREDGLGR
jgi:hypothetical protein